MIATFIFICLLWSSCSQLLRSCLSRFERNIVFSSKLATASALRLGRLTVSKARIKKIEQSKLQSVIMDLINTRIIIITFNVINDCQGVPFL